MTQSPQPTMYRPNAVVIERVKEVRKKRGLSAQRLAEELTRVGLKWDRSVVANLESGRRSGISVEELLALAYVLDVAPVHLLVPFEADGLYWVAPEYAVTPGLAREWIRGRAPMPAGSARDYFSEIPEDEYVAPRFTSEDVEAQDAITDRLRQLRSQED